MNISNQTILITGGASGLGYATAQYLSDKGAKVAILDLPSEQLQKSAETLGALPLGCDITSAEQVEDALKTLKSELGAPRILINCAGISAGARIVGRDGPADLDQFAKIVQVNLIGTFNMMRLVAPMMIELDPLEDGERGVIVNTSSVAAYEGQIGQAAYAASKGGIASLTLPAAREFARSGIRVLAIAPGIFHTPLMDVLPQEVQDSLAASIPFPSRLGAPEEFAALATHMIENKMLNGENIRLDGALRLAPK